MISKPIYILLLFLVASLLALTGCASAKEVTTGMDADGTQVDLKEGQMLVISLESNPSTGFGWHVAEIDEAIIQQAGETEFIQEESDEQLVGTGGMEVLRFEATGSGTTTLTLAYARIWEDVVPEKTFTITIVVP